MQVEYEAAAALGLTVKGKKMRYTAINGNMFSFLSPQGDVCLRFGEDRRAALAAQFHTGPVRQYGAVMRGYVAVSDGANIAGLLAESLAFARTLKPKPTKR